MIRNNDAVAGMMSYVIITGILMMLLVVVLGVVNTVFMQGPSDTLKFHEYTDIGNGVSVRIVDLYVIAPPMGKVDTNFELPHDVADEWYAANIIASGTAQAVVVGQGNQNDAVVNLSGIGATMGVSGTATGSGITIISYDSKRLGGG
jgi:hypothetical protein